MNWNIDENGYGELHNDYFPENEVPQMDFNLPEGSGVDIKTLSMKYLSDLNDIGMDEKIIHLNSLVNAYSNWIDSLEEKTSSLNEKYIPIARNNIEKCRKSRDRMLAGIRILETNTKAAASFMLANRAMFMQRVHLTIQPKRDVYPNDAEMSHILDNLDYRRDGDITSDKYFWRPFQLAFLLMSISSITEDNGDDRETVDLIWFPTGGGKTEAYLGLTAFTIFYRRLAHLSEAGGTAVIMRYTLRLLAAQQFTRASTLNRCKFLHAVWFPSINETQFAEINLPSEADRNLTLTKEALANPKEHIDRVFDIELPSGRFTNLSENDTNRMIKEILCPSFHVFPSSSMEIDIKKMRFHRLLKEQALILDFLVEQKTAVINGLAGTGKTVIALEKAKRHAVQGEKVLFLCFNVKLKEHLSKSCVDENIDFYTIAGLACNYCNTTTPDYERLKEKLEAMYFSHGFPYRHVIVDEGQDFGMDNIAETDILEIIRDIITDDETVEGSFYIFYDRMQMIQSEHLPSIIENADCKLTLYKNCRNTANIATTSLKPISQRKPKVFEGCVRGVPAKIHFCSSSEKTEAAVNQIISSLKTDNYDNIVILTCKTESHSALNDFVSDNLYKGYRFTTCRKFKGLEADAVILVDVDRDTFEQENVLRFYVGASRARLRLAIAANLSDDDCIDILRNQLNYREKIKKPKKDFARALNSTATLI